MVSPALSSITAFEEHAAGPILTDQLAPPEIILVDDLSGNEEDPLPANEPVGLPLDGWAAQDVIDIPSGSEESEDDNAISTQIEEAEHPGIPFLLNRPSAPHFFPLKIPLADGTTQIAK